MATVMHSQKADGKAHMFVPSREDMQRRRLLFEWVQECGRDDSVTYMDLTATYGEPEVHEWECSACGELAADELERSRDALRDVEIAERRIADALRDVGGA